MIKLVVKILRLVVEVVIKCYEMNNQEMKTA